MDVNDNILFRIITILVFIEKVVTANANTDPQKNIKKQRYLFDVAIQGFWDCLPPDNGSINNTKVSESLQKIYNFASRRDAVCVRALLNTCLILLNSLHPYAVLPQHIAPLLNAEAAICKILETYDPELSNERSITVGEEMAAEILQYLEAL